MAVDRPEVGAILQKGQAYESMEKRKKDSIKLAGTIDLFLAMKINVGLYLTPYSKRNPH